MWGWMVGIFVVGDWVGIGCCFGEGVLGEG